ncbi:MAG: hypothetical protein PVH88_15765 [Ignavibacteria bacterium]|jgi:hypothetical protein
MTKKTEPWFIHAVLWVIIIVLAVVLIQVAIIQPREVVKMENYYQSESRLRMSNIREAQKLWMEEFGKFTDNLDSLVYYIENDTNVAKLLTEIDTITGRSKNPFKDLTNGTFTADSLLLSPKSHSSYNLAVDTSVSVDTVIDRRGRVIKIDSVITIGTKYFVECPDGYGKIGDLYNDALINAASWE